MLGRHGQTPVFCGVVHLLPLPGGPRESPGLGQVLRRAEADAAALVRGGADALIVENLGDAPFEASSVEPFTVAAMTLAVRCVQDQAGDTLVGVNVLRNDARAALSIAAATGAQFIRVNVHTGAMVTDQGIIEGRARQTLMLRRRLSANVRIIADVLVKHAAPLGNWTLEQATRDLASRGNADVIVVSGDGTGRPTDPTHVRRAIAAAQEVPVWIGSGITPDTASDHLSHGPIAGAIVGTWLHEASDLAKPVELARVEAMRAALR